MTIREISKKLVLGGGVTLASVGLTTCSDDGAVDPAPPPLQCSEVGSGQTLGASGTVSGTQLAVRVVHNGTYRSQAGWKEGARVTALSGLAKVVSATPSRTEMGVLDVILELQAPSTTSGSFLLEGTLADAQNTCPVKRQFTFSITGSAVKLTELRRQLPLERRGEARIELVRREGREVELRARASAGGRVGWTVTGGSLAVAPGRVRWSLPEAPGLYQAELLVEHEDGLALDTLVLEVG